MKDGYDIRYQYQVVTYLGFTFMIMFVAFNGYSLMISKLFQQYHYQNLGQSALMFTYLLFGLFSIVATYFIKKIGFSRIMVLSAIGYVIFEASGMLVLLEGAISRTTIVLAINLGAIICGVSAATLWIAQSAYINLIASKDRKGQLFGLFQAIRAVSPIIGNIGGAYILREVDNLAFFEIISFIGLISAIMFLALPRLKQESQDNKQIEFSLQKQIQSIWQIMINKKHRSLIYYFSYPGIVIAFYSGFFYKLVALSVKEIQNQPQQQKDKRINSSIAIVFIFLGIGQLAAGMFMNRYSQLYSKYIVSKNISLTVIFVSILSLLLYFMRWYPLCYCCAFLWGFSDIMLQVNGNAIIGQVFQTNMAAFGVFKLVITLTTFIMLLLVIMLSQFSNIIYLLLVVILSYILSRYAYSLQQIYSNKNLNKQFQLQQK